MRRSRAASSARDLLFGGGVHGAVRREDAPAGGGDRAVVGARHPQRVLVVARADPRRVRVRVDEARGDDAVAVVDDRRPCPSRRRAGRPADRVVVVEDAASSITPSGLSGVARAGSHVTMRLAAMPTRLTTSSSQSSGELAAAIAARRLEDARRARRRDASRRGSDAAAHREDARGGLLAARAERAATPRPRERAPRAPRRRGPPASRRAARRSRRARRGRRLRRRGAGSPSSRGRRRRGRRENPRSRRSRSVQIACESVAGGSASSAG